MRRAAAVTVVSRETVNSVCPATMVRKGRIDMAGLPKAAVTAISELSARGRT
jgi:hypothetical protein